MNWSLITGTGRSGTSCFAKLLNECFPDKFMMGAGFWKDEINAGYEGLVSRLIENHHGGVEIPDGMIIKDPRGTHMLPELVKEGCKPSFVFVCFRNLDHAAMSRTHNNMRHTTALEDFFNSRPLMRSFESTLIRVHGDSFEGMRQLQLMSDHIAISTMVGCLWENKIPHAVINFPEFTTEPDELYDAVNKYSPIEKNFFMEKYNSVMDPSKVHHK